MAPKTLLFTGITGSLGRAFLAHSGWDGRIRGLSRDEQKHYQLKRLLAESEVTTEQVQLVIGDTRSYDKMLWVTRDCEVVVHAAALKIIGDGNFAADEFMRTNILGTWNVIRAAVQNGVSKILFVSTDKGCEPHNFYGATKMIGEGLCLNANDWSQTTHISCVRYGNVEMSRGSFTHTLTAAKPGDTVNVTDIECTRFWITLSGAVNFIDMAIDKMEGGEIFVPRLPAKSLREMIPEGVNVNRIGLKQGEKLHETLIGMHELPYTDAHGEYFVIRRWPHRGSLAESVPYRSNSEAGWGML